MVGKTRRGASKKKRTLAASGRKNARRSYAKVRIIGLIKTSGNGQRTCRGDNGLVSQH